MLRVLAAVETTGIPISVWKPKSRLPYVIGSKYFSGSTQP